MGYIGTTLKIDEEVWRKLKYISVETKTPFYKVVNKALKEWLEKVKKSE